MKRQYVDSDEKRKTDMNLSGHIGATVDRARRAVSEAGDLTKDKQKDHMHKHEELMAATHDHMTEVSRLQPILYFYLKNLYSPTQNSIVFHVLYSKSKTDKYKVFM